MEPKRIKELEKLLSSFESVLNSSKEQDIHIFLDKNHDLLKFNTYGGFVSSKFKLADKYIPDFVTIEHMIQALNTPITFIEIERANKKLFTKSGDPTSFLTHAVRQVQDWKAWISIAIPQYIYTYP
jgi:hypothetical protein